MTTYDATRDARAHQLARRAATQYRASARRAAVALLAGDRDTERRERRRARWYERLTFALAREAGATYHARCWLYE